MDEQPPPPGPGASQRPGGLTPQRAAPAGCGQAEAVKGAAPTSGQPHEALDVAAGGGLVCLSIGKTPRPGH